MGPRPRRGPLASVRGILNFKVDGAGRPLAYLFAPPLTAQYSYRKIAIGRVV
jgi:hypothetical protein